MVQIAQLAALRGTTSVGLPHAVVSWAYIIHADVLREGNRLDEALELALPGVQLSEQTETIVALNLAYTVLMHVYQARGELDAAHLAFEKAALFSRLKMQESMQALTGYLDTVLATSPQNGNEYESQSERVEQRTMSQSLLDPLSKRERDVLRLIARGDSNAEIAKELVLALDTVKRHVYNLFSKLGVKNRMQAVASARALGLLSKEL